MTRKKVTNITRRANLNKKSTTVDIKGSRARANAVAEVLHVRINRSLGSQELTENVLARAMNELADVLKSVIPPSKFEPKVKAEYEGARVVVSCSFYCHLSKQILTLRMRVQ